MSEGRILHKEIQLKQSLKSFLKDQVHLSSEQIHHLLEFGAIYLNKKRKTEDCELDVGDYLRIHLKPKRFPLPKKGANLIHFENESFIVAYKSFGLPTLPSLDNIKENLQKILEEQLGHKLYSVHRLDQETTGLILFAKNKESAKELGSLLTKRKLHKEYLAISTKQLPTARYSHFIDTRSVPCKVYEQEQEFSKSCILEILESKPVDFSGKRDLYPDEFFTNSSTHFQQKIRLETGRTHQIRAQLAFLNSPLINDPLYSGKPEDTAFVLQSSRIWFNFKNESYEFECP